MAYNVSKNFRDKVYSGESLYTYTLTIDDVVIPEIMISKITIKNQILDKDAKQMYIGTFVSQVLEIQFRNMIGINLHSGSEVELSITSDSTNETVPIGKYIVDDLAENYTKKCKITCMDYAVKFKNNVDYSSLFYKLTTDTSINDKKTYYKKTGTYLFEKVENPIQAELSEYYEDTKKTTLIEILRFLCEYFGVELGTYPNVNNDVEVTVYDSEVSGKRFISYIAEMFGGNAKIGRDGKLNIIPSKQEPAVTIDADKGKSWELGEKYEVTQLTWTDAVNNYTYGDKYIKKNVSGNNVIVEDAANAKLNSLTIKGNSVQDGTPTPTTPVEVKTVKGITNLISGVGNTSNGLTTINNNGEIKVSGTTNNTWANLTRNNASDSLPLGIGTYTLSISGLETYYLRMSCYYEDGTNGIVTTLTPTAPKATFTLSKKATRYYLWLYNFASGTTINTTYKVMLEQGSVSHEFVPYGTWLVNKTCGKNLLDGSKKYYTYNNIYFGSKTDGATSMELEAGTYTFSVDKVCTVQILPEDGISGTLFSASNTNKLTFTLATKTKIRPRVQGSGVITSADSITQAQIEKGSTATTYEPYKEHTSLIDMNVYNLYNKNNENVLKTYITNSNGATGEQQNNQRTLWIKIKPNTEYKVKKILSSRFAVATYNVQPSYSTNCVNFVTDYNATELSITGTANSNYLAVWYYNSNSDTLSEEVIKDSIVITGGEPQYHELCKIGDIQDTYKDGVITKRIGKVVLNGSESGWTDRQSYNSADRFVISEFFKDNNKNIICDYLPTETSLKDTYPYILNNNKQLVINFSAKGTTTLSQFKTWLASNNVTVYYVLATPYEINVSHEDIELFEGYNLLSIEDDIVEEVNFEYSKNDNTGNTLFIRSDNIYVNDTQQIKNIYDCVRNLKIYTLKEENVADVSLDSWDIIKFTRENGTEEYTTYNNSTITCTSSLMTKIETKIPTETQEVTTNYVGTEEARYRRLKTTVDFDNNRIELLAGETKDNQEKIAKLQINVDSIQNIFKITGGNNLIKNSALLLKDQTWIFDNLADNTFHTSPGDAYDSSVIGALASCSQIKLKNSRMTSDITTGNVQITKIGDSYTFNFYYKLDSTATAKVTIKDGLTNEVIEEMPLTATNTWTRVQYPKAPVGDEEQTLWKPTSTIYKIVIESTTSLDGMLYIGDLMFNAGELRTWQTAAGELSSTVVQLSSYGVQVISSSTNIATLMSAEGFGVYPIDSNGKISGSAITDFDSEGIKTKIAKTDKVYTGHYVMDEMTFDGVEHHVEYFRN